MSLPLIAFVVSLAFTLTLSYASFVSSRSIRLVVTPGALFDNFQGPPGAPPNSQYWDYDLGDGGWGNNELQAYTDSPDNVRLDGQGHLVIEARRTPTGYTSGRLVTRGKADMMYGTITARIKFPSGHGLLPAFWMVGSDMARAGWPECGEVDVMELPDIGTVSNTALHGPWRRAGADSNGWVVSTKGSAGVDLSNDFHDYWVTHQPDKIVIGVDGNTLGTYTRSSLPPQGEWVFDKPMYAILDIAVGGDWPGAPDDSTPFPATMLVEWFRYTP